MDGYTHTYMTRMHAHTYTHIHDMHARTDAHTQCTTTNPDQPPIQDLIQPKHMTHDTLFHLQITGATTFVRKTKSLDNRTITGSPTTGCCEMHLFRCHWALVSAVTDGHTASRFTPGAAAAMGDQKP